MDEKRIREIVREEMADNYRSGDPKTPPHQHDGVSGLKISILNLNGVSPLPSAPNKYLNPSGSYEFGFSSDKQLAPASPGRTEQYMADPKAPIIPIPIVVGNGVGDQGIFQEGYAPDGTMALFSTGSQSSSFLYIRFDGRWYQINIDAIN